MSEPTPRQVLYALVAGGFILVVAILVVGAAVAGLVPGWWTGVMAISIMGFSVWGALNWRRTWPLLLGSIGLFVLWTVVTLIVA
ncbi:MAG TPA: hypothetical protein VIW94_01910 [Acidimicrobiia bacterium]